MIDAYLSGPGEEALQLEALGNKLQERFRFIVQPRPGAAPVQLRQSLPGLLHVSRHQGVLVSLDQSEGISLYAGIPRQLYVLSCVMLGLLYWRVLVLNPLLVWEDMFVREAPECLCAARATLQEYALAFERPWVCPSCLEFFRCVGVEPETAALQEVLSHLIQTQEGALAESK